MAKYLMIIESPNKRLKLQQILGKDWDVKATVGHFKELSNKGLGGIGIDKSFNPIFQFTPSKITTWKKITDGLDQYQQIMIATDPDREGEAIAYHVYSSLPSKYQGKASRVVFHEISKNAIQKAVNNPGRINMPLVYAQYARQIGDKMIGFEGSNIMRRTTGLKSTGRVQGVALWFVIERQKEIRDYKPIRKNRYNISIQDETNKKVGLTHVDEKHQPIVYDLDQVPAVLGQTCRIKDVIVQNPTVTPPPKPLITSSVLQKGTQLKLSAKQVTSILQTLFEDGLITYPRTDSYTMSDEFKTHLLNYLDQIQLPRRSAIINHKSKQSSQGAHEPIRVVDMNITPNDVRISVLGANEKKVYKMIYDFTLVQGLNDSVHQDTHYIFHDTKHNLFKTTTKKYLNPGWKDYFGTDGDISYVFNKDKNYPMEVQLENFVANKKPTHYTESEFIKRLEKEEIGRPSTYASYSAILRDRGYVEPTNNVLIPNQNGWQAYEANQKYLSDFVNRDFTGKKFEPILDQITEEKLDFRQPLKEWYDQLKQISSSLGIAQNDQKQTQYQKPIQESSTHKCKNCHQNRIKVTTSNKRQYYKCSSSKFDPNTKTWSGCPIEWINDQNNVQNNFKFQKKDQKEL